MGRRDLARRLERLQRELVEAQARSSRRLLRSLTDEQLDRLERVVTSGDVGAAVALWSALRSGGM
jgi:hypothetical protein